MVNYQNGKIYKIVNNSNNMEYWGSTTTNLKRRFSSHKTSSNYDEYKRKPFFKELNENPDCFKILLVENYACNSKNELEAREYELMNRRKDEIGREYLYNLQFSFSGEGHFHHNKITSEETKIKMSVSQKGRPQPEDKKIKISNTLKGRYRGSTNPTFKRGSIYEDKNRYRFGWSVYEDGERKSKSKTFNFNKFGGKENALQEAINFQNTIYPL